MENEIKLPFATAAQLAAALGLEKRTMLDHLIRKYPQRNGIPRCPYRKLGEEYYFVIANVERWLEDPFTFAEPRSAKCVG